MRQHVGIIVVVILLLAGAAFVGYRAWNERNTQIERSAESKSGVPVAVEVAPIESGLIRDIRTLSGSLEARSQFTVAAKAGGLIEKIHVDLGDEVKQGEVIAEIDDGEFVQAVAQADAELAVRQAEQARAESDRNLAQRDYDRAQALKDRGIASESQLDETSAALESAKAELELAKARVQQAEASLELARIRLGYTRVRATWSGDPNSATVAERYQETGNTIEPGDPIVSVASLDPLTAVVTVTEGDYARLAVGQNATLVTDARPQERFEAVVSRIAPVFRESSRQARVELTVANPHHLLRPGVFIRVRIVLREADVDTIVPAAAVIKRGGRNVVFMLSDDGKTVAERAVEIGIVQSDRVQIISPSLTGRVVVLGQQLLEDGASVTVSTASVSSMEEDG